MIENIDQMENLKPILNGLGKNHITSGVTKEDYDTLGIAKMNALKQILGDGFTFELKRAWSMVWEALKKELIGFNYDTLDHSKHILRNC